jgi:hypothetical protein
MYTFMPKPGGKNTGREMLMVKNDVTKKTNRFTNKERVIPVDILKEVYVRKNPIPEPPGLGDRKIRDPTDMPTVIKPRHYELMPSAASIPPHSSIPLQIMQIEQKLEKISTEVAGITKLLDVTRQNQSKIAMLVRSLVKDRRG